MIAGRNNDPQNGDEIEFQLLTDGLGFQKNLGKSLKDNSLAVSKTNDSMSSIPKLPPSFRPNSPIKSTSSPKLFNDVQISNDRSKLPHHSFMNLDEKKQLLKTSFARDAASENRTESRIDVSDIPTVSAGDVSMLNQFTAWLCDVVLIVLTVTSAIIFLDQLNPGIWTTSDGSFRWQDTSFYFLSFFSMLYLIYFSLSEAFGGQSLGKYIFNIQVVDDFGERPKIYQTLLRSLLSLSFILSAGLFALYQIHGSVSRTRLQSAIKDISASRREELV